MEIHFFQFILGIILFFIINWIGKHSYSFGYMQISMFLKTEEAPAFNFLFRILSPIVYLFIISAILYKVNLDKFVVNIYFVSIYYIIFRLLFNLATNRALLMNWYRQILYWITIVSVSYFSYTEIIYKKENILPDFTTISNELWVIILIFIFHTFNKIRFSPDKTIKRKDNYLNNRISHFQRKYSSLINDITENDKLKSIVYAIIIYEDFNRPKIVRLIENISFILTKRKHSLGVMQVSTNKLISDSKSVKLGVAKLKNAYEKELRERKLNNKKNIRKLYTDAWHIEWSMQNNIISEYNGGESYSHEVNTLASKIFELNKSKNKSYLFPTYNGEEEKYNDENDY